MSYLLATQVHTNRVSLHHGRLTVHVDNQAWQVVALTMHQSVSIVVGVVSDANGLTHLQGRRQTGIPEFIVNLHIRECQDAHGNRAFLVVANGDKIARISHHTYHFTLTDTFINLGNSTREHPWMEPLEALFLTFTQPYLFHDHQCLSVRNRPSVPVATALHRA